MRSRFRALVCRFGHGLNGGNGAGSGLSGFGEEFEKADVRHPTPLYPFGAPRSAPEICRSFTSTRRQSRGRLLKRSSGHKRLLKIEKNPPTVTRAEGRLTRRGGFLKSTASSPTTITAHNGCGSL